MLDKPCCIIKKALNHSLPKIPDEPFSAEYTANGGKSGWGTIFDVRWNQKENIIIVEYRNEKDERNHRLIHMDTTSAIYPKEIEDLEPKPY